MNPLQAELIGLSVTVVSSTNPSLLNLFGTIIDETRNTLIIRTPTAKKIVPKNTSVFCIHFPSGPQNIPGYQLVSRPEDRIKRNTPPS